MASKERKESLTFSTSNKIVTNAKKKSSRKKKRSIKCKSPDNPSTIAPPPPYEIASLPLKRSKNEKSFSPKDNVIRVTSSNFKRSSLKRDSTALRVRAARERFQKLSRGEPVKMNDIYEFKEEKNYLLCQENVKDEEKNSVEFICKGTLNEKKAELLKLSSKNCLCSCDCTCAILGDDKSLERQGKDGVKSGLVKSQIQFFKAIENGRNNELNTININEKPVEKFDNCLRGEKVRKTFAKQMNKSYSLSMINKLISTVNNEDEEQILSTNYKNNKLVKNVSWPIICQTCNNYDSCSCDHHLLTENFDNFCRSLNSKNNCYSNKISPFSIKKESKDEEVADALQQKFNEVQVNEDEENLNTKPNIIPIELSKSNSTLSTKSLINLEVNKAIMKENLTSVSMNSNSLINNENYGDTLQYNKSHNLYANNIGEPDDYSTLPNIISLPLLPDNKDNTSIPFSSLSNIAKISTSQNTRNNGVSTLKKTLREDIGGKDIPSKPSSGAVPKKYRPNSLLKKRSKKGKSSSEISCRNHSPAEGTEPDSGKITK